MFSRSNSDPLILFLSIRLRASPHRRRTLALAAPTGPPLVLREPQFLKFRPGRSTSLRNGLACTALELVAPRFRCNPCAGTAPQLRQRYCPNSDHAKLLSIIQARESPRPHAYPKVRAWKNGGLAGLPWVCAGRAAIRPKDRRISQGNSALRRQAGERSFRLRALWAGAYRSIE
jgi:hypothetical protein